MGSSSRARKAAAASSHSRSSRRIQDEDRRQLEYEHQQRHREEDRYLRHHGGDARNLINYDLWQAIESRRREREDSDRAWEQEQ